MFRFGIVFAAALSLCPAQEETEANPEYAAWSKQKPGAWVKWTVETTGAMKLTSELTLKLRELTPEKAVLEEKTVLASGGEPHAGTRVVPAKIRKGATAEGEKVAVQKEGEEPLTIRGKEMKCKWVELRLTERQGRTIKIWRSDEVVGGVAKTVTQHDEAPKLTLTMTAVDWKAAE
jgi:hypothetical protein